MVYRIYQKTSQKYVYFTWKCQEQIACHWPIFLAPFPKTRSRRHWWGLEFSFASKDPFFPACNSRNKSSCTWTCEIHVFNKNGLFWKICNGSKIGNKMVLCNACNTGCVSFEVDILKHWNVRYHWFQLRAWDHWRVSELNEYHIVRSPSTCDSSDLNAFHFLMCVDAYVKGAPLE